MNDKETKETIRVYVTKQLKEKIQDSAKIRDMSISQWMKEAAMEMLERDKSKTD